MIEVVDAFKVLHATFGEKAEGLAPSDLLFESGLDSADLLEWIVTLEDETDQLLEIDIDDLDVATLTLGGFVARIREISE